MNAIVRTEIHSQAFESLLQAAGARAPTGIARALNRAGVPTENAYVRKCKLVLGLKEHRYAKASVGDAVKRHTSRKKATASNLKYSLAGWGAGFPLIYYQPKETPAGATVNWLGQRKLIARSFYLGGKFPRRKKSAISHAVWRRTGKGRWALDRPKGPGLPDAMAARPAVAVWEGEASKRLPPALIKELTAILKGYA